MFLIFDLQTVFYTEFVGMVFVHLHTRLHMPTYCSSLIIVIRLKTMFMQQPCCFYILCKKIALIIVAVFEALISHNFRIIHESRADVALSSQVCVSARLLGL